jgi:hypothetical protein
MTVLLVWLQPVLVVGERIKSLDDDRRIARLLTSQQLPPLAHVMGLRSAPTVKSPDTGRVAARTMV